jgi:CheY-like chemotaxis protein
MSVVTAPVAIACLVAITFAAIAVGWAATLRARAASAALRASEAKHDDRVDDRKTEGPGRLAGGVVHDLTDLLTVIIGHTDLLIASVDPSGPIIQAAREIRRAALSAARLTTPLATTPDTHDERDAARASPSEPVQIVVVDTRGGTAADTRSKPFEPFRAGEDAGVASADAIVTPPDGRIQLEPAAGVGTMLINGVTATPDAAAERDPASAEKRMRAPVMVVDDEPHVRELIRVILARGGHRVLAVAGPHAALATLNRQPAISLMLVDVVMPEMDGYDLVVEARKISPGIRVVLMSGFARDPTRHPSGDGFLAKPFTVESLSAIVEDMLDAPCAQREPGAGVQLTDVL